MAVPKKKVSKQRKHKRRTHYKLAAPGFVACPKCHALKLPHIVCKACGSYKGKEVIKVGDEA